MAGTLPSLNESAARLHARGALAQAERAWPVPDRLPGRRGSATAAAVHRLRSTHSTCARGRRYPGIDTVNPNVFRNALLATTLAALGAACSQGAPGADAQDAATTATAGSPVAGMADGAVAPVRDAAMVAAAPARPLPALARAPADGAADAPDRGDLVAYPAERVVRQSGPYTWHRADISEAHALRAVAGGVLTLTAPSGQLLKFEYDRHQVHPSGNWTWIGRALGGGAAQDAILTFGREAVFGTIAQAGAAPLKLTMQDGASWLVETDLAARSRQSEASGRYRSPDFLVPGELPVVDALQAKAAAGEVRGAAAAATMTVDVVVGYTNGYRAALGSTEAVTTRLDYLVAVTNESYVNSEVDARVRMVHAMEVNYLDGNDNSDALTALTGSTGSTPDPTLIHAALKPLHVARDQYGADLISLVRDFQHPEAVSCGVAWLIGGGQNITHTGYSVFGTSIVSDGNDGGFFCEDTTFAHELGHNMGLAHDRDTAKGEDGVLEPEDYGRFEYSFGLRTGLTDGSFMTVMAYSDGQINSYHVFSNPDITYCGGHPCGVEGQADNARTLVQTIPIIVEFRETVVPDVPVPTAYVVDDIDGDGDSDLTWRSNDDTRFAYWLMDDANVVDSVVFGVGQQWTVVAKGDFNADGVADLVWSNGTALYLWAGDGEGTFDSSRIGRVPNGWSVFGAGDVNGDLKDDLIWRNNARTRVGYWLMDGAEHVATSTFAAAPQWVLSVTDDFNADGMVDLVWTNGSRVVLWTSTGTGFDSARIRAHPGGWTLVDSGDVDGDGKAELHWRSDANDRYAYWLMDGSNYLGARVWRVSDAWTLASVGDYNGDSFVDLAWTSDARVVVWLSDGGSFDSRTVRSYPTGWTLLR